MRSNVFAVFKKLATTKLIVSRCGTEYDLGKGNALMSARTSTSRAVCFTENIFTQDIPG